MAEENKNVKILINSAFVGSYADGVDNLSREVINFVQEDNGRYYIYLSPYGNITDELLHLDYVLFVKNAGNGLVEIIAKAKVGTNPIIFTDGISIEGKSVKIKDDDIEMYDSRVENSKITYGGRTLREIFKLKDKYDEVVVTMQVEEVCLPKKAIFLTTSEIKKAANDNVYLLTSLDRIANTSMRAKFFDGNSDLDILYEIINNSELWGDCVKTFDEQKDNIDTNNNFFKATLQQDNEVMFSNMLFYLFQNYHNYNCDLFNDFANEVLAKKDERMKDIGSTVGNPCWIMREDEKMDLKIITDKYYIVIENKIKSGINGLKRENGTYPRDEQGKFKSQLSNYFEKVEKEKIKKGSVKREFVGFVFHPNYNDINLDNYSYGDKYKKISYKMLYDFFSKYKGEASRDMYMSDFIKALKKHTELTENEKRNDLMYRLKKRIEG